ncbi:MAG: UbiX family flavin prenyltransferase [Planctomycetota bacterium]|jgi:4-hydroxy-3-polyprenylbenzoate decarboxylase
MLHERTDPSRRIVLGISGASGALYARRALRALVSQEYQVHLTITDAGRRLLHDELGMGLRDISALAGLPECDDPSEHGLYVHPIKDIGATIASGSFETRGMIVMPCSAHTLGAIASGLGDTLLTRAAAVTLKERRPLVLCHRESPLTMIDIENMRRVTEAGGIVAPTSPGFYLGPRTIDDLVDFVVARSLDLLGVEHGLDVRWGEQPESLT